MSPLLLVALAALGLLVWLNRGRLAPRLAPMLAGQGAAGLAMLGAALLLFLLRQPALAAPLGLLALTLLRRAFAQAQPIPQAGGRTEARTDTLAMWLDRDSGEIGGEVLAGRFAGRGLADLDAAELGELADDLADDPDSLGLLLAYLERRRAEEPPRSDAGPGAGPAAAPGREMSEAEALRILGLSPGATRAEVRAAHRRLMLRVHPDLGGSDALAATINAAKARLDP